MTIWNIAGFLFGLLFTVVLVGLIILVVVVMFTLIVFSVGSIKDLFKGGA